MSGLDLPQPGLPAHNPQSRQHAQSCVSGASTLILARLGVFCHKFLWAKPLCLGLRLARLAGAIRDALLANVEARLADVDVVCLEDYDKGVCDEATCQRIIHVCRERGVKFLAVRVISDDMSADLPEEVRTVIGSSGSARFGAALGALWKRPGSVKDMWHLRETAHTASEHLATFLDGVVKQLHSAKH